jgi:hypothetical protein
MIGVGNNTEMAWATDGEGISVNVPPALADSGKYCWEFEIEYSA